MDGSASNRMYQNLVVRGRCLKNKIQAGDYDFYYANSHHGMMINKKTNKVTIGTVRSPDIFYKPHFCTISGVNCIETSSVVSVSEKAKFISFVTQSNIDL